jgi:hypothetical protein
VGPHCTGVLQLGSEDGFSLFQTVQYSGALVAALDYKLLDGPDDSP